MNNMANEKKWYHSKSVWASVAFVAVAFLQFYEVPLPYEAIISALAGLGLYGLRTAEKKIA